MTVDWKLVALFCVLLTGCLVEPAVNADGETISTYNAEILKTWVAIATPVITLIGTVITVWLVNRAAKKSEAAIEAANHQNEKLMVITEKLLRTDEKSNATDRQVEKLTNGSPVPAAPAVVVVQIPAAAAVAEPAPVVITNAAPVPVVETKEKL